jgi:hypothetical protein
MYNPLLWITEALNSLRSNVWAAGLIGVGAVLVLHGHGDVGGSLVTGGFAILRSEGNQTAQIQPQPQAQAPKKE